MGANPSANLSNAIVKLLWVRFKLSKQTFELKQRVYDIYRYINDKRRENQCTHIFFSGVTGWENNPSQQGPGAVIALSMLLSVITTCAVSYHSFIESISHNNVLTQLRPSVYCIVNYPCICVRTTYTNTQCQVTMTESTESGIGLFYLCVQHP